ncbi:MAG: 3-methylornithyl-N6-L-lysine dehydrogenase PylD [Bacillota bacterium]|nr:3-methylornithyl-N6-L-lysine dehydrogenase PylD [Bacillota bacterium]
MTRLISEQVVNIPHTLNEYDEDLKRKTSYSLKEIAVLAVGTGAAIINPEDYKVAVIPVASGQGIISGFSEAVRAIAVYLGFNSYITEAADLGGLIEAYQGNTDAIILADDFNYAAINLNNRKVADNTGATAKGYVTALSKMAGGIKDKEVLLIGAGPVGMRAAENLCEAGAIPVIYDRDKRKEQVLAEGLKKKFHMGIKFGLSLGEILDRVTLIFDASPGRNLIKADQLSEKTMVAAPGLPLGFDQEALKIIEPRLIHDPLQLGTAVMLFDVFTKPFHQLYLEE